MKNSKILVQRKIQKKSDFVFKGFITDITKLEYFFEKFFEIRNNSGRYPIIENYLYRQKSTKHFSGNSNPSIVIFTVLYQDRKGGLQVQNRKTKNWHDVPFNKKALVVNTGRALEFLSKGKFKATNHRVLWNKS